jgi:hypothetical protein
MKHCVECHFFKKAVIDMGNGPGMAYVCSHEECSDPVSGDPLPCNLARQSPSFCGVNARYYKEAEKIISADKKVIEIAKS